MCQGCNRSHRTLDIPLSSSPTFLVRAFARRGLDHAHTPMGLTLARLAFAVREEGVVYRLFDYAAYTTADDLVVRRANHVPGGTLLLVEDLSNDRDVCTSVSPGHRLPDEVFGDPPAASLDWPASHADPFLPSSPRFTSSPSHPGPMLSS